MMGAARRVQHQVTEWKSRIRKKMAKCKRKRTKNSVKLSMTAKVRHDTRFPKVVSCLTRIKSRNAPIAQGIRRKGQPCDIATHLDLTIKRKSVRSAKCESKIIHTKRHEMSSDSNQSLASTSKHNNTILRYPSSSKEIAVRDLNYELFSRSECSSNSDIETENEDEPFYRTFDSSNQNITVDETFMDTDVLSPLKTNRMLSSTPYSQVSKPESQHEYFTNIAESQPKMIRPEGGNETDFEYNRHLYQPNYNRHYELGFRDVIFDFNIDKFIKKNMDREQSMETHTTHSCNPVPGIVNNMPPNDENSLNSDTDTSEMSENQLQLQAEHSLNDIKLLESTCCICPLKDEDVLLILTCPASVGLRGVVSVRVLWGCVDICGYKLKQKETFTSLFSPKSHSKIFLIAQSVPYPENQSQLSQLREQLKSQLLAYGATNETAKSFSEHCHKNITVILCKKLRDNVVSYISRFYKGIFEPPPTRHKVNSLLLPRCYGYMFDSTTVGSCLTFDEDWQQAVFSIQAYMKTEERPPIVLVCGGRHVGKSTFCRYLLNTLLNECEYVNFIDCDPGQCEFTPPGMLSYLKVSEPCLGPAYTHLQECVMSIFLGTVSVQDHLDLYVKCIQKLWKIFSESSCQTQPLIVNTMGWSKGFGLALLVDIIHVMQPTHVIQIDCSTTKGRNFKPLTMDYLLVTSGWKFRYSDVDRSYNHIMLYSYQYLRQSAVPIFLRHLSLFAYFSKFQQDPCNAKPLNHLPSKKIPWSSVALHVCHTHVSNKYILYVYNASIVALCISDPEQMISTCDPTLPKFLKEVPLCKCLGYGIVRGISMEEKCFYVITSLSKDDLAKVNTMLVGSLQIPKEMLLEQDVTTHIPYITKKKEESSLQIGLIPVGKLSFKTPKHPAMMARRRNY